MIDEASEFDAIGITPAVVDVPLNPEHHLPLTSVKQLLSNQTVTVELTDRKMHTNIIFVIVSFNSIWNHPAND